MSNTADQQPGQEIRTRLRTMQDIFAKRLERPAAAETDEILNRMMSAYIREALKITQNYYEIFEPIFASKIYLTKAETALAHQSLDAYSEAFDVLEDILEKMDGARRTKDSDNQLSAFFARTVNSDYNEIRQIKSLIEMDWSKRKLDLAALRRPGPKLAFSASPPGQNAP